MSKKRRIILCRICRRNLPIQVMKVKLLSIGPQWICQECDK